MPKRTDIHKILVIGSGPIVIGQAAEFDYAGTQACLYQMEEICREMSARGMTKPLFIGGATTSALHTAVKLAPLYEHVYYGADASAAAVMAKKYTMDPETFEKEQHKEQDHLRELYEKGEEASSLTGTISVGTEDSVYGSVTVNGADLIYDGTLYSLDETNGDLTLSIEELFNAVFVYSAGTLVSSGAAMSGVVISGRNHTMEVSSGGLHTRVAEGRPQFPLSLL